MADRADRCSRCGAQLLGLHNARGSIRCALCRGAITPAPVDQLQKRVRRAKDWVKRLAAPLCSQFTLSSATPQHGGYGLRPPLRYPPTHGKKRALLVGITYQSKRYALKGSVNDVNCMKFLLQSKFGFPEHCILVLTEEKSDPCEIPTRENMLAAMRWLVHGCQRGDSLVFHYSGHGSQQIDTNDDELDGYDETLCPLDYKSNGMISDDEVHATIVQPLPQGVRLHAVIDACHSGSLLDLPYVCKMNRDGSWQWEGYTRGHKETSGGLAICFSGCDDNQASSDTSAFSGDIMTGALTFCFIRVVENEPGITYGHMLHSMRIAIREANTGVGMGCQIASLLKKLFQTGLIQEPQLSSSEKFDVFQRPFTL